MADMKRRVVYVDDATWSAMTVLAEGRGISISDLVRQQFTDGLGQAVEFPVQVTTGPIAPCETASSAAPVRDPYTEFHPVPKKGTK